MKRKQVKETQQTLKAVCEATLVYRTKMKYSELPKVERSEDVYEHLKHHYATQPFDGKEYFFVTLLNRCNKIMATVKISEGGIAGTVVDFKLVFMAALLSGASYIILSHNHPSENPKPSEADLSLTRKIKEAAILLDIKLLDHIIVCRDVYYSIADNGQV